MDTVTQRYHLRAYRLCFNRRSYVTPVG